METKTLKFDIKAAGETGKGEFSGYAAVYGNKDRNGEVIDIGAMTRSINANDGEFPLLWQHMHDEPIGVVRLEDVARGAKAVGRVNLESELGRKAYSLMIPPDGFKRAALRDMSIGYFVNKEDMQEGTRHLKEIHLIEVSLVTVAANPKANIVSVKTQAEQDERLRQLEKQVKVLQATLSENGILIDPGIAHSVMNEADEILGGPGNVSDDSGNAHSLSELLSEMSLYEVRRQLNERVYDDRDQRSQKGLGRH